MYTPMSLKSELWKQTWAAWEVGVLAVARPGPGQVTLYLRLDSLYQSGTVSIGVREP